MNQRRFTPISGKKFIRAEILYESESIVLTKAYYRNFNDGLIYYCDLDYGKKDEAGDIVGYTTLLTKRVAI